MKILYPVINGEITGGNIICLKIMEEAIKRGYETVANSPAEGKFTDIIREKGIKVYNIDTRHSFRLDSVIRLAGIIKKENINLVHSHTPLSGMIISRIAGKLTNVPVINHVHGLVPLNPHPIIKRCQLFLNIITAKIIKCWIIAVCENTRRDLIKCGAPEDKIQVLYNGILTENGQAKNFKSRNNVLEELGLSLSSLLIGQVGRIDVKKGQHILINAAERVLAKFSNAFFLIVGEDFQNGSYQRQLKILAKKMGVFNRIIFAGYRPDIIDIMNAFDIFILPSLGEGLPVVILEAMAAKKPVIATNVGGNGEIVINQETGTIIPPNDADRLAEAIIFHLENPGTSKKMGERGYERVKQYFSLSQMTGKIMDIYKEVLN